MATPAQLAANRANARLSTGPRSAAGRARARLNAVTHGAYARVLVLEREDREAFETLRAGFAEALAPVGRYERVLVERLSLIWWRMQRAVEAETQVLAANGYDDARLSRDAKRHIRQIDRIGAIEHRLQQAFERCHAILDRRQALRRRHSPPPATPQTPSCAGLTRASTTSGAADAKTQMPGSSPGMTNERGHGRVANWLRFVKKRWEPLKSITCQDLAETFSAPFRRLRGPPPAVARAGLVAGHAAMQHPPGGDHQNVILGLTG